MNNQYNAFTQQLLLSIWGFVPRVVYTKAVNVISALYLCLSYGFISILTMGQLLICLANQVNQTSANRLAVADVALICLVEFPRKVTVGQIVIEQVAECQAVTALLVQQTISFLIDNEQAAVSLFLRCPAEKYNPPKTQPKTKKLNRKQIQKEA